jgi:hypothetical protein
MVSDVIGKIPYRMAFAGGWIDQPFVSKFNPSPPGSMVVVSLQPISYFMEYCGIGTSTRSMAIKLWGDHLPQEDPAKLLVDLYEAENQDTAEPSGSQDMAGIIYPGVSRLDYDYAFEGGFFPMHVESNNDPQVAAWLEEVIYVLPIAQRPTGYNPLGIKNLDPQWIARLGQSGALCYDAIISRNIQALGESMKLCMQCWETILPHVVKHPGLTPQLFPLLLFYQQRYAGAMYSGCGGGYLYVASEEPVPGAFKVKVRIASQGNGYSV